LRGAEIVLFRLLASHTKSESLSFLAYYKYNICKCNYIVEKNQKNTRTISKDLQTRIKAAVERVDLDALVNHEESESGLEGMQALSLSNLVRHGRQENGFDGFVDPKYEVFMEPNGICAYLSTPTNDWFAEMKIQIQDGSVSNSFYFY
jgi:predicted ribonuclease YlaK